jgi:hypothetical protein
MKSSYRYVDLNCVLFFVLFTFLRQAYCWHDDFQSVFSAEGNILDDLTRSWQTELRGLFQNACDADCCGQGPTGIRISSLPCCQSCDDLILPSTLRLPFSLPTCPCPDGQNGPQCCVKAQSLPPVRKPTTTAHPEASHTESAKPVRETLTRIDGCPCSGGRGVSPACCNPMAHLSLKSFKEECDCGDGSKAWYCCGQDAQPGPFKVCACNDGTGTYSAPCCSR